MADTKAEKALTEANYTVKLILGGSSKAEARVIDITESVLEALSYDEVFDGSMEDAGIAHSIIGLLETSANPNFLASTPLHTDRNNLFLLQDVEKVLNASIVNGKQLQAIKDLIRLAFDKRADDSLRGVDFALREQLGKTGSI